MQLVVTSMEVSGILFSKAPPCASFKARTHNLRVLPFSSLIAPLPSSFDVPRCRRSCTLARSLLYSVLDGMHSSLPTAMPMLALGLHVTHKRVELGLCGATLRSRARSEKYQEFFKPASNPDIREATT